MQARLPPTTVVAFLTCLAVGACGRTSSGPDAGSVRSGDAPAANRDVSAGDTGGGLGPDLPGAEPLADIARVGGDDVEGSPGDVALADGLVPADATTENDGAKDAVVRSDGPKDTAAPDGTSGDLATRDLGLAEIDRDLARAEANPGADSVASDLAPEAGQSDAAPDVGVVAVDGALAAFCSGDSPKMVLNGEASSPTVTGRILPLDCCDGGEFVVTTPSFGHTLFFAWEVQVGPSASRFPATIDLANPANGWGARVIVGCDTSGAECYPAPDSYTSGLEGLLQVGRADASYAFDMSVCLHVAEPAGSSHPLVHTLDLYAPHVSTP